MPDNPLMDRAEHARLLVAYEGWANQRILTNLFGLDESDAGPGASWETVFGSMAHVVESQAVWMSRFRAGEYTPLQPTQLSELETEARRLQADMVDFAAGLVDRDLGRLVKFTDKRGNHHEDYLSILLTHLINHGTYHRGEAALLLTQAGRSPGDLDLVLYRRQTTPGT